MRIVLCNQCVKARGGSSAVGRESAFSVLAGICDDCDRALCYCDGRHTMPRCPLRAVSGRVGELRAFFVVEGPPAACACAVRDHDPSRCPLALPRPRPVTLEAIATEFREAMKEGGK